MTGTARSNLGGTPARARQVDAPTYLTLADAAAVVGQSVKTLRRRIASGALPAYRFGPRLIRVRLDELQNSGRPMQPQPQRAEATR